MSEARRLADALANARTFTSAAATAAGKHRNRAGSGKPSWDAHLGDLRDLRAAVETLHFLNADLAAAAKALADDALTNYFHGPTPDNKPWDPSVHDAARNAHQTLSRLRSHLDKTPVARAHDALISLVETVRTEVRAARRADPHNPHRADS